MTDTEEAILIAGTRDDRPDGQRTLRPRQATSEPNRRLWFGAEFNGSGDQVWFRIDEESIGRLPRQDARGQGPPPHRRALLSRVKNACGWCSAEQETRAGSRTGPRSGRARPRPGRAAADESTTAVGTNSPGASRRPGWRSTRSCSAKPSLLRGAPPGAEVLQVLVAQGVVPQQVRLALRQGEQDRPLPAGQDDRDFDPGLRPGRRCSQGRALTGRPVRGLPPFGSHRSL